MINDNTRGLALAATTSILWGFLAVVLKIALKHFDSYTIVWIRFLVAFICLFIYTYFKYPSHLSILRKPPWLLVLGAVLLGANYIGYMQGVHYAGPGITQVVIQNGAITLGLVGFIFFKEQLTKLRILGFVIAAIGFTIFYYQQFVNVEMAIGDIKIGLVWILFGAWTWTGYAIINKLLIKKWHAQQLNLIFYGVPALLFIPLVDFSSLLGDHPWWAYVLLVVLGFNTLLAYGALSASFKYIEANKISILITLNPIITFVFLEGLLFFEINWISIQHFPPVAYLGASLVLIGAIFAIGFKGKIKK